MSVELQYCDNILTMLMQHNEDSANSADTRLTDVEINAEEKQEVPGVC